MKKLSPDQMYFLGKLREISQMWLYEVKELLGSQYNARVNEIRDYLGCTCKTYGKGMKKTCPAREHIFNKIKYQNGQKSSMFYHEILSLSDRQKEDILIHPEKYSHIQPYKKPSPDSPGVKKYRNTLNRLFVNNRHNMFIKIINAKSERNDLLFWLKSNEKTVPGYAERLADYQRIQDQIKNLEQEIGGDTQ